jgi:hypothetical protein
LKYNNKEDQDEKRKMIALMIIKEINIQKIKKEKDNNSQKISKIKDNIKGRQIKKEKCYLKIVIKDLHRNKDKNLAARSQQNKVKKDKNKKKGKKKDKDKDTNLNLDRLNLENSKVNIEKHKIHKKKFQGLRIVQNRTK